MCILLFNLVGHRFLAGYMQQRSARQLEANLDNDRYNESQLIELKIPLNLPYQISWLSYERCYGEIEIGGITYKYVKRKLCDDTLSLKCIPDMVKMRLQTAENNFFKSSNDLAQNGGSKKSDNSKTDTLKKPVSEYNENPFLFSSNQLSLQPQNFGLITMQRILFDIHALPWQPPEFLCRFTFFT